jgi:inosine-uridine nucleoside N-ribohydrolase
VAVAAAIDGSLFEIKRLPVLVETAGHYSAGQTMPVLRSDDDEAHLIDICVDVDGARFVDMFVERIAALRDSRDVAS